MSEIFKLGLTGGIGSGKSTVAKLLSDMGAAIVDADAIARQVTLANGAALPEIVRIFGADMLNPAGAMDREKMRALVYADPTARKRLESIIHPEVASEIQRQTQRVTLDAHPCIVFDVPLLVESKTWRQKVDHVLVVDCTPEVQIDRVMARNPLTRAEVEKIIATQATRPRRLAAADSVIFNVGLSLRELATEVHEISHRFGLSSKSHMDYPKI